MIRLLIYCISNFLQKHQINDTLTFQSINDIANIEKKYFELNSTTSYIFRFPQYLGLPSSFLKLKSTYPVHQHIEETLQWLLGHHLHHCIDIGMKRKFYPCSVSLPGFELHPEEKVKF